MCEWLDAVEKKCHAEGRAEGRAEERSAAVQNLIRENLDKALIIRLGYTEEEYEKAKDALQTRNY